MRDTIKIVEVNTMIINTLILLNFVYSMEVFHFKEISLESVIAGGPEIYPTDVIIAKQGYTSESHYVTTPDGYILNIHRIPARTQSKEDSKVVLLQHGLQDSSASWLLAGPEKSLAYILHHEGYDVWLGNSRGNFYSRNHTDLNPDEDPQFWYFSWHEMGVYDLPTTIDYILNITGQNDLYYVAHSQGTTLMYVMCSMKPEYNQKIKVYAHMAPIAFVENIYSPLLRAASSENLYKVLLYTIGDEFVSGCGYIKSIISNVCTFNPLTTLCKHFLFFLAGFSPGQSNSTILPLILTYVPAGSSTRQFIHYGQTLTSGKFCQYDHGILENIKRYNQEQPPEYKLYKISTPGYLFHSYNDWVSDVRDVEKLCTQLSSVRGKFLIPDLEFNHYDFLFGINATELVYRNIVKVFSEH